MRFAMAFIAAPVVCGAVPLFGETTAVPLSAAPAKGFAVCAACHGSTAVTNPGPDLRGIIGRSAGKAPGYRYSRALRNSGLVWTPATLDAFLADPQAVVPGTTMPFAGEPDAAVRAEIIAALAALK